jgi:hypothetical protein
MRIESGMQMTLFSQTAQAQANFLGDIQKLKERHVDRDVGHISISGDITVTLGFTMLLVRDMIELDESSVVALELIPANDNAKELFANLVELLSPPTKSDMDEDEDHGCDSPQNYSTYSCMGYNCGIVKSDRFPKLDGCYIVTIPAGIGIIPEVPWLHRRVVLKPISAAITSTYRHERVKEKILRRAKSQFIGV